jgi:hypothetical protein
MENIEMTNKEGYGTCIRKTWDELNAPKDKETITRAKNLVYVARKCYTLENGQGMNLDNLNELETKLNMEVTK